MISSYASMCMICPGAPRVINSPCPALASIPPRYGAILAGFRDGRGNDAGKRKRAAKPFGLPFGAMVDGVRRCFRPDHF